MMLRQALEPVDYPFFDYRRLTFSLAIAAGGSIFLSGSTAARFEGGRMVVTGDLLAQAGLIHDKMRATLLSAGRGLADVVRVVRYVTPAALAELPALDAAHATLFAKGAVISTIVVRSLLRPEALIEIEAVASAGSARPVEYLPGITAADRATAWAAANAALSARGRRWSEVLRAVELLTPPAATMEREALPVGAAHAMRVVMPRLVGDSDGAQIEMAVPGPASATTLFVTADGDPSLPDVAGQCRDVYRRLGRILKDAGSSLDAVVKTTEFIVPAALADYRTTAAVRRETFAAPYPAATGVICERMSQPGTLIAVEAIAVTGP